MVPFGESPIEFDTIRHLRPFAEHALIEQNALRIFGENALSIDVFKGRLQTYLRELTQQFLQLVARLMRTMNSNTPTSRD
jgi:hypothetical protein